MVRRTVCVIYLTAGQYQPTSIQYRTLPYSISNYSVVSFLHFSTVVLCYKYMYMLVYYH